MRVVLLSQYYRAHSGYGNPDQSHLNKALDKTGCHSTNISPYLELSCLWTYISLVRQLLNMTGYMCLYVIRVYTSWCNHQSFTKTRKIGPAEFKKGIVLRLMIWKVHTNIFFFEDKTHFSWRNCQKTAALSLPVIKSDKIDGNTKMAVSSWSTDSMQICLSMLREVKVDHHIYSLNVYTSCE